jgi:hypothetical protein
MRDFEANRRYTFLNKIKNTGKKRRKGENISEYKKALH